MTQSYLCCLEFTIHNEAETEAFASKLAAQLTAPLWIELEGKLGVGKTTLTRYLLRALGHTGSVKSPTYTLVEPYQLDIGTLLHFDLYRLGEAEELDYLGIRDYIEADTIAVVEWPSKGYGFLPACDLKIQLEMDQQKRNLKLTANSAKGEQIMSAL